jgi:hypothetical protein
VQPKAELLSLQQIRCFCAAVESGSFTAAAVALRVTQPAVAEQVRKPNTRSVPTSSSAPAAASC